MVRPMRWLLPLLLSTPWLGPPDVGGCRWPSVDGQRALGGPVGLCVRDAVELSLEPGQRQLALLVDAPHRFDPRVRPRVFIYRVEGRRLVPRFLGSGFSSAEVVAIAADGPRLRLQLSDSRTVWCHFDGFPLVCSEEPP